MHNAKNCAHWFMVPIVVSIYSFNPSFASNHELSPREQRAADRQQHERDYRQKRDREKVRKAKQAELKNKRTQRDANESQP